MEMHQIRYFLAVCETLNFTRAAEQCHVAQPSLTRAIQKLEEELGGPLFRRERNRTHLTDLGRLIQPHLARIQAASQIAHAEAQGYNSLDKAPLRLGVMSTIGPLRLVEFLNELHAEIPSLDLSPHEARGAGLVEALMGGEIDVGLVGLPSYPERLDARPLYEERYVVTFPKGHRFEGMNAVPIRELDREAYLKRTHCEFTDYYKAMGAPVPFQVDIRYTTEREDWIQAMVLAGLGCSIVPEYLPTLPGLINRVIVDPAVNRTISLVTVAGRRFSPTVQAFLRLAQRFDWSRA